VTKEKSFITLTPDGDWPGSMFAISSC
jgi:hypothetical protein